MGRKKSIVFVNTDMCWGGIEVSLINLLWKMDYDQYDIHLVLLSENLAFLDRLPQHVTVHLLNRNSPELSYPYGKLCSAISRLGAKKRNIVERVLFRVLRAAEKNLYVRCVSKKLGRFDTAVAYRPGIAADVAFSLCSKKKIGFYHYGYVSKVKSDAKQMMKAEMVACVSDGIRQRVNAIYPECKEKTCVIHNLSNFSFVKEAGLAETVKPEGKWHLVTCGRLVRDKGFDLLLHAVSALLTDGYDLHLTVIGGADGSGFDKVLYDLTRKLNLKDNVTFAGWINVPYSMMRSADIYVQPSRYEAYGIAIREAQILGLPILSTKTPGGLELIEDGINGVLCEAEFDSIYRALKKMMDDPALLKRLSDGCANIDFEQADQEAVQALCNLFCSD